MDDTSDRQPDDDIKVMRTTARRVGLTQVLIDIARSRASMAAADIHMLEDHLKLLQALRLLGVADDELRGHR